MQNGLFMIGLPEKTLEIVQKISQKTGMGIQDVIGNAIADLARKHLTKDDFKENQNPAAQGKPGMILG